LSADIELLWNVGTGNALSRAGEWQTAANYYERAVELEKPSEHKANLLAHEAYARVKAGDATAMKQLDAAIRELQNPDYLVSDETIRTWLSGALLKKAELLLKENPQTAQHVLAEAAEVINDEPVLPVRLKQLQRLQEQLAA
jgi:tetratricopeptide (TPR) repeat protein